MRKSFKRSVFGYQRKQVEYYLTNFKKDYEEELSKKKDRMLELDQENRILKAKLQEYEQKLASYKEQEAFISKALVKAEQKAQNIIEEGQRKVAADRYKLKDERNKWKIREQEIRRQLLDFEREVYGLMESFSSEINYLASKEVCEALLEEESIEEAERDSAMLKVSAL